MLLKKNYKFVFRLAVLAVLFLGFFNIASVNALTSTDGSGGDSSMEKGITTQFEAAVGTKGAGYGAYRSPYQTIGTVISAVLAFLGVIFVVLMVYGGFLWMTAGGKEDQVKKAKDLIRNAVIGLAVILTAEIVTYFVIDKLLLATGA